MCKFNGKSIEVRTINGETVYHGKQTLLALGYSSYSHTPYKVLSSLSPEECIKIPYSARKTGTFNTYWITRAGLNKLAAINSQAPAHCSHTTNWGKFLRQLDEKALSAGVISKFSSTTDSEKFPPLFSKIDNLIEEYQEFRGQYMKMQEELRRLEAENARLKRNFAKAREVFTECAAGF